jgi:hypothetical protein
MHHEASFSRSIFSKSNTDFSFQPNEAAAKNSFYNRFHSRIAGFDSSPRGLSEVDGPTHAVMEGFAPNAVYRGPEALYRNGALAKYGLLDLSYDVSPNMAAQNACPGLSMLKELGIVSHSDAWKELKDADPMAFLPEYLLEFDKHETILKLFLEEQPRRPFPSTKEGETLVAWLEQPNLIPFPIPFPRTMEITDACITNSDSVWLNKHFYI